MALMSPFLEDHSQYCGLSREAGGRCGQRDGWGTTGGTGSDGREPGMPGPAGTGDAGPRELGGTGEWAEPRSILAGGVVWGGEQRHPSAREKPF